MQRLRNISPAALRENSVLGVFVLIGIVQAIPDRPKRTLTSRFRIVSMMICVCYISVVRSSPCRLC